MERPRYSSQTTLAGPSKRAATNHGPQAKINPRLQTQNWCLRQCISSHEVTCVICRVLIPLTPLPPCALTGSNGDAFIAVAADPRASTTGGGIFAKVTTNVTGTNATAISAAARATCRKMGTLCASSSASVTPLLLLPSRSVNGLLPSTRSTICL